MKNIAILSMLSALAVPALAHDNCECECKCKPEPQVWETCAKENGKCSWSNNLPQGRRLVRYGADGQYKYLQTMYPTAPYKALRCRAATFGGVDPAPGKTKTCEYLVERMTKTLPASTSPMPSPTIKLDKIPLGDVGSNTLDLQPNNKKPKPNEIGAFRTFCLPSHLNFDDAIVKPGQPNSSHLHQYFGNTTSNAFSTLESLSKGSSTCAGGAANKSSYWIPAMIDAQGLVIVPESAIVYYKTGYGGVDPKSVIAPPRGLKMLAGDMMADSKQRVVEYACLSNRSNNRRKESMVDAISACSDNGTLRIKLSFPQCWDGRNLDSPDHRSHTAYASRGCPDSHPIPLNHIHFAVDYKIDTVEEALKWRLSSDMYGTDKPGGYSFHGDWFGAWDDAISARWIKNCSHASADCGVDNLGDGQSLRRPKNIKLGK